jgi:hypothetical protein
LGATEFYFCTQLPFIENMVGADTM